MPAWLVGLLYLCRSFFSIYTDGHSETYSLQREANNCKPLCHLSSDSCLPNSSSFVCTGSRLESFPNILLPLYMRFPLDMFPFEYFWFFSRCIFCSFSLSKECQNVIPSDIIAVGTCFSDRKKINYKYRSLRS